MEVGAGKLRGGFVFGFTLLLLTGKSVVGHENTDTAGEDKQPLESVSSPLTGESHYLNDQRIQQMDRIVQPIVTSNQLNGGGREYNRGSGFVVGDRFYTVHHNLKMLGASAEDKKSIHVDGMPVKKPFFSDVSQDLAVIELSEKACIKHCNNIDLTQFSSLGHNQKVYWLRKFQGEKLIKEARIDKSVVLGEVSSNNSEPFSCTNNLVILVDQPFIPGSSGAPVMDAKTDQIVGVIQGSISDDGVEKGYFKPIHCVLQRMHADSGSPIDY